MPIDESGKGLRLTEALCEECEKGNCAKCKGHVTTRDNCWFNCHCDCRYKAKQVTPAPAPIPFKEPPPPISLAKFRQAHSP